MTAYQSQWRQGDVLAVSEMATKFFAAELTPSQERWESQHHVDRDFWNKAGDLGLMLCSIPEQYGGGGGTFAYDLAVFEAQARAIDSSWGNAVHSGIVAHYLLAYGTEAQRQQWLPKLATGELVSAVAMTEPGAGSDLQSITTRADRDGDEWVINGAKTFITNGSQADLIVVVAKTDPTARAKGISLIVVETADCPGFRRGRVLSKVGQQGADTSELFFDDVRVPIDNLLGGMEGQGFVHLMQQLPQERLIIGITAVAAMETAVAETIRYTKERQAFGKSLFDLQNTRFELAECATLAHAGRVFIDSCIDRHLNGDLDTATASMVKWWLTDLQCQVIDRCLQLFGGYGYMTEYPIAKMYADARVSKIYGGSNEVMKEVIARTL